MGDGLESLPDDIETLKAGLIVARAKAAAARARQSDDQALIAHLKLQIEKLNRDRARRKPRDDADNTQRAHAGVYHGVPRT